MAPAATAETSADSDREALTALALSNPEILEGLSRAPGEAQRRGIQRLIQTTRRSGLPEVPKPPGAFQGFHGNYGMAPRLAHSSKADGRRIAISPRERRSTPACCSSSKTWLTLGLLAATHSASAAWVIPDRRGP